MKTLITRELGNPSVFWSEHSSSPEISTEDVISILGKGTSRRNSSLAKGVHSLPPFHMIEFDGEKKFSKYRTSFLGALPFSPAIDFKPSHFQLAKTIRDSVKQSISGYNRVGLMLSGGFDSTILAFLLKETKIEVKTYTAESPGACGPKEWNFSWQVAKKLGFTSTRVEIDCECLENVRDKLLMRHPTPTLCWITASQYKIAERASDDGCECLISGIGSDEAFGGYHKTSRFAWRFGEFKDSCGVDAAWDMLINNRNSKNQLLSIGQCCPFPKFLLKRLFPDHDVEQSLDQDVKEIYREVWQSNPKTDITSAMLEVELELRIADILLPELAVASSEFHIPIAYPFLRPEVLVHAAKLPISLKYCYEKCPELIVRPKTKAVDKYLLRMAFQDMLPEFVCDRPRNTFTLPYGFWLRQNNRLKREMQSIYDSTFWKSCGSNISALPLLFKGSLSGNPWALPFRIWVAGRLCAWWDSGGLERLNKYAIRF